MVEPARAVGGDFYDFFFLPQNRFCVFIGDVSGKGVPAALLMARAMTLLRTRAQSPDPPERILARVNEDLLAGNEDCMFATVFLALLDLETGDLAYAGGGHNPPIFRRNGRPPGYLESPGGPALGLIPGGTFTAYRRRLEAGDTLILYTDGVTEARNSDGEMFGEERLLAAVEGRTADSPRDEMERIRRAVTEHARDVRPSDDLTLLVLRYLDDPASIKDSSRSKPLPLEKESP
jgi:sigma-B regulation protein RsbU (phosphoserine phosphatase)